MEKQAILYRRYVHVNIKLKKIDIPERTYTDNIQGTYAAYIIADYTD